MGQVEFDVQDGVLTARVPKHRLLDKERIMGEFEFSLERRKLLKGEDVEICGEMRLADAYMRTVAEEVVVFSAGE